MHITGSWRPWRRIVTLWLCLSFLALLVIASCTESTRPPGPQPRPGDPKVTFVPSEDSVSMGLNEVQEFAVLLENISGAVVHFYRGDSILSDQESYQYLASRLGPDSLRATVTYPDSAHEKEWYLWVELGSEEPPPAIADLVVTHGPKPGSLRLTWTALPEQAVPRPLAFYIVGISYSPLNTEEDWQVAQILEVIPSDSQQGSYIRHYDDEYSAVHPGEVAWLVVRVEDTAGVMSPLLGVRSIRITAPYWLEGLVRDDTSDPLPGVIVGYGCDTCKTVTDGAGQFTLGPFRDIDKYVLTVSDDGIGIPGIGSYYDFSSDSVGVDTEQPLEMVLINAWGLDPECTYEVYDGDFLNFLRELTWTSIQMNDRPNYELLKWPEYPVRVYVNEGINESQTLDLDSLARVAMADWNESMGEVYFLEVAQADQADLEVIFTSDISQLGIVDIIEPPGYNLNEVIPERMRMRVTKHMEYLEPTMSVLLHEFAHTLCIGNHSQCSNHIIFHHPDVVTIHEDDVRLARSIRYLPQAVPMDHYSID